MDFTGKVVAGTGHRPNKLENGYGRETFEKLVRLCSHALTRLQPVEVISGMALGYDQALAEACVRLHLPFAAYVPFTGQESNWPTDSQRSYNLLMAHASRVVVVCEGGYAPWKMQKRNMRMFDDYEIVLGLWNKTPGGTANAVGYGREIGRPILNLWTRWSTGDF